MGALNFPTRRAAVCLFLALMLLGLLLQFSQANGMSGLRMSGLRDAGGGAAGSATSSFGHMQDALTYRDPSLRVDGSNYVYSTSFGEVTVSPLPALNWFMVSWKIPSGDSVVTAATFILQENHADAFALFTGALTVVSVEATDGRFIAYVDAAYGSKEKYETVARFTFRADFGRTSLPKFSVDLYKYDYKVDSKCVDSFLQPCERSTYWNDKGVELKDFEWVWVTVPDSRYDTYTYSENGKPNQDITAMSPSSTIDASKSVTASSLKLFKDDKTKEWTISWKGQQEQSTTIAYSPVLLANAVTVTFPINQALIDPTFGLTSTGSTSYPTAKAVTATNQAQVDTAQSMFGGASGLFDGTGDYLSTADSPDWNFGTGNVTIDAWIRLPALPAEGQDWTIYEQYVDANDRIWLTVALWTSYYVRFKVISGGSTIISASKVWTPVVNTWYHIALVRSVNDWMTFVNGTQIGTPTTDVDGVPDFAGSVSIGGETSWNSFNGWIDELRVSKGVARWTSNFTPSTARYNRDSYTVLLLHMDGADASPTFLDDVTTGKALATEVGLTSKTVTVNGDVQIDTAQSNFGGASGLFDGTGDYLSTADSPDWDFGSGNFTIDFWVRFNALPGAAAYMALYSQAVDGSHYIVLYLYNTAGTYSWHLDVYGGLSVSGDTTISTGTWYHIAAVRAGGNAYIFQAGSQKGSNAVSGTISDYGASLTIGEFLGANYFNGWIDEYRVSKGVARWTSGFTPPTSAYTVDANTVLLLHNNGTDASKIFIDDPNVASFTVTSISVYSHAAGNMRVSMFTESGNAPSTLICESSDTAVSATAWTQISVSCAVQTAQVWWLNLQWNPGTAYLTGPSYTAGSAGNYIYQAYGTFPATWTGGTASTENWSIYATYTTNVAPTNGAASITDMDDTDNVYAQKKLYTASSAATDTNGYADIHYMEIRFKQGAATRAAFRYHQDDDSFSVTAGATEWTLDPSSSDSSVGNTITVTWKFTPQWDATEEADLEIEVYVEDAAGLSATNTAQTNYFDVVTRLVTSGLASDDSRINIGGASTISGTAYYGNDPASNAASASYPPDAEFTSVIIHDAAHATFATDATIVNGAFSASAAIPSAVQSNTYHVYLNMADADYTDADAPDGDTTAVIGDRVQVQSYTVADPRVDVNTNVNIDVLLWYDYDNTAVTDGTVTINTFAAAHQGAGTWRITKTSAAVIAVTYDTVAASGNTHGISTVDQNGKSVAVVWDRIKVLTLALTDLRINANGVETSTLYATAELEYNNHALGAGDSLTIGGIALAWNAGTSRFEGATATSAAVTSTTYNTFTAGSEADFGITAGNINGQTATVIYDKLQVQGYAVNDSRTDLNVNIGINATIWFDFDNTVCTTATLTINGFAATHLGSGVYQIVRSSAAVAGITYNTVAASAETTFGITTVDQNGQSQLVVWDRILIYDLTANATSVLVSEPVLLTLTLTYEYDNASIVAGTFTLNGVSMAYDAGPTWNATVTSATGVCFNYTTVAGSDTAYVLTGVNGNSTFVAVTWGVPAPYGLTLTASTVDASTMMNVAWTDNSTGESDYHIERSLNGVAWSQITTVLSGTTTYSDSLLSPSTTYYYRVRAHRHADGVYSSYTSTASRVTGPGSPPGPTGTGSSAMSMILLGIDYQVVQGVVTDLTLTVQVKGVTLQYTITSVSFDKSWVRFGGKLPSTWNPAASGQVSKITLPFRVNATEVGDYPVHCTIHWKTGSYELETTMDLKVRVVASGLGIFPTPATGAGIDITKALPIGIIVVGATGAAIWMRRRKEF